MVVKLYLFHMYKYFSVSILFQQHHTRLVKIGNRQFYVFSLLFFTGENFASAYSKMFGSHGTSIRHQFARVTMLMLYHT
jgi:hypothetical protein